MNAKPPASYTKNSIQQHNNSSILADFHQTKIEKASMAWEQDVKALNQYYITTIVHFNKAASFSRLFNIIFKFILVLCHVKGKNMLSGYVSHCVVF